LLPRGDRRAVCVSYTCAITLPKIGETFNGGYFDYTFYATTMTHEDWHFQYMAALINSTYGALERWCATYFSDCSLTPASASALGNSDLANARAVAKAAFDKDFNTDLKYEKAADFILLQDDGR